MQGRLSQLPPAEAKIQSGQVAATQHMPVRTHSQKHPRNSELPVNVRGVEVVTVAFQHLEVPTLDGKDTKQRGIKIK